MRRFRFISSPRSTTVLFANFGILGGSQKNWKPLCWFLDNALQSSVDERFEGLLGHSIHLRGKVLSWVSDVRVGYRRPGLLTYLSVLPLLAVSFPAAHFPWSDCSPHTDCFSGAVKLPMSLLEKDRLIVSPSGVRFSFYRTFLSWSSSVCCHSP